MEIGVGVWRELELRSCHEGRISQNVTFQIYADYIMFTEYRYP